MLIAKRLSVVWIVLLLVTSAPAQTTQTTQPVLPPGTKFISDLWYVENGHERQKLDLYLPAAAQTRDVPLVIYIHGGGWRLGDRKQPPAAMLLSHGYAVASIEHRYTTDAIFPSQIHDVKAAVRWLRAHARDYRLDGSRFAAWGASSGGHLALMLGVSPDIRSLDGDGGNLDQSSRVQCVIDFYGTVEFRKPIEFPLNENRLRALGGTPGERPELAALVTPITHVTPDDAPVLIVHGEADPVVAIAHSEAIAAALKAVNVEVRFIRVPNGGHGGSEFTRESIHAEVFQFLDRHLNPAE